MKKLISILLLICTLTICLSSCGNNGNDENNNNDNRVKITESAIRSKLSDEDGTLTIEGASDDVMSLTYVVTNINASKLIDKSYTREAVNTLLTDSSKITYGELKVCNAFSATSNVVSLFTNDDSEFDSNAYTDEILSIICDASTKTYGDWKVSATIDKDADSITIVATRK